MTDMIASKPRRHQWSNERRIPACESVDGNDRTEKTCGNPGCCLVKITVHPPRGFPFRRWRHRNGNEFDLGCTPPCLLNEYAEMSVR